MSGLGLLQELIGASVAGLSGPVHWTFPGFRARGYGPRVTQHPVGPWGSAGASEQLPACRLPLLSPALPLPTQICTSAHQGHRPPRRASGTKPVGCLPSQPQTGARNSAPLGAQGLWPDPAGPSWALQGGATARLGVRWRGVCRERGPPGL